MRKSILDSSSLSQFLNLEYQSRHERNPAYSYRAFARDLEISVSHLSDILNGRNGISRALGVRLQTALKLSTEEYEVLWSVAESEFSRSKQKRAAAVQRLQEVRRKLAVRKISIEEFSEISDWYHFALLERTRVEGLSWDSEVLCERLQLTPHEVETAFQKLLSLNLVTREDKTFRSTGNLAVGGVIPSETIRKFHKQVGTLALASIDTQGPESRMLSSNINAVKKADLPRAFEAIQAFVEKFNEEFGSGERGDAVYALSIQMFDTQVT